MEKKTIAWQEKLWSRVRLAPKDNCWIWPMSKSRQGYGFMNANHKVKLTHRMAWESIHGAIPKGMQVCHTCDNPACCRPDHLFLGTPAQNMKDKRDKGRQSRGNDYCSAKLNPKMVLKIREMHATGRYTQKQIGDVFGCSNKNVGYILRGKAWSHVAEVA